MSQSPALNSLLARRFAASLAASLQQGDGVVKGARTFQVTKAAPPGPPGS